MHIHCVVFKSHTYVRTYLCEFFIYLQYMVLLLIFFLQYLMQLATCMWFLSESNV